MILSTLLKSIDPLQPSGVAPTGAKTGRSHAADPAQIDIGSLHYRAQEVEPGGLFVAITGHAADGHDYIGTAVSNGAAALVVEKPVATDVPWLQVHDSRAALASLSAAFFGHPSEKMTLVGITGTNGKTTVSYLIEAAFKAAGYSTGVIGTINYRYGGRDYKNPVTTPESLDLQRILAQMQAAGVSHVVMEASSHGIDLHRVDRCWLDVGVFTNLSQDHLDYHGTMDAYWGCKKRLFTQNLSSGPKQGRTRAVINGNDPRGRELLEELELPCLSVGSNPEYTVSAVSGQSTLSGNRGRLITPVGELDYQSALVGRHNQENILCAVGAALALDVPLPAIEKGLAALERVPGRLEPVPNTCDRYVYVDYAHTPDALKHVLASLRALADRRIICVFGCGGDRDRDKRPRMGRDAALGSDLCIVTSDNPRSESPQAIIEQILPGVTGVVSRRYSTAELKHGFSQRGFAVEPDRRQAIELALRSSAAGDAILIAGKGHEDYQILANQTIHFDDRQEAQAVLAQMNAETTRVNSPNPAAGEPSGYRWSVSDVLKATGGDLINGSPDQRFAGIQIDSRRIGPRDAFVAIVGETHDGHDFAAQVVRQGVRVLIVEAGRCKDVDLQNWRKPGTSVVAVSDTTRALGDLANFHRRRTAVPIVAITGSNGKTTTREMTAAVTARRLATHSTKKNFNNHIGLPLTILEIERRHACAVVELGMNAPGEIDRLAQICEPDIGVITNIGPAHLEGVGSIEGVQKAKAELLPRIRSDGTAILNADDPRVKSLADQLPLDTLLYGIHPEARVRARSIQATGSGSDFELCLPDRQVTVHLPVPGAFMVSNSLAAAAVGFRLGVPADDIAAALEAFRPVRGRNTMVTLKNGVHLIDDTYNANPGSMQAALEVLSSLSKGARSIFVAGDMLELGRETERLHRRLGARAARSQVAYLYAAGQLAGETARGALEAGMQPECVVTGTKPEISQALVSLLRAGDWVLVKGSRGMKMEDVVQALKEWAEKNA